MKFTKKGLFFDLIMFFVVFVILTTAIIVLYNKQNQFKKGYMIGDRQFSLINTYQKAEKILFYIDQSAKYSLQQSIYDLSQNGGISEIENLGADEGPADYKCGKFSDAYVWFEIKKTQNGYDLTKCFEESSVNASLIYLFDGNFKDYISNYPVEIPLGNYKYDIKESGLVGLAAEPVKINIFVNKKNGINAKTMMPANPIEYKVDSQGKIIDITKKAADGKEIPDDKSKTKSLVDFSGVASAKQGASNIDITGICARGNVCSLTNEAYSLLLEAQKKAQQKGISLEVTEGYRSKQEQIDIWEGRTASKYNIRYPNEAERRKYVCYPYGDDAEKRCSHLSGNAVDIRFRDKTFETMAGADWKTLSDIMASAGWVRYGDVKNTHVGEPWHFECCGTDRYARAKAQGVDEIV